MAAPLILGTYSLNVLGEVANSGVKHHSSMMTTSQKSTIFEILKRTQSDACKVLWCEDCVILEDRSPSHFVGYEVER